MLALLGLRDPYGHDGRVLTEVLHEWAVPHSLREHKGTLEHLWHDDPSDPQVAYMLIRDGDPEGLKQDLHAHEVIALYDVS